MSASRAGDGRDEPEPEDLESDVDSGMEFYTDDGMHVFYDVENPLAFIAIDSDAVVDIERDMLW